VEWLIQSDEEAATLIGHVILRAILSSCVLLLSAIGSVGFSPVIKSDADEATESSPLYKAAAIVWTSTRSSFTLPPLRLPPLAPPAPIKHKDTHEKLMRSYGFIQMILLG
jgi:hypothetical protein